MGHHYDRLGNVMDLTDENGNLSASYDQSAFGNVLEGSQSGYHLTTKEFNQPIGLYYFFMRWYDPILGRFTQKDLYHFFNRYVYCVDNPINYIDPYGLMSNEECKRACRLLAFMSGLSGGLICGGLGLIGGTLGTPGFGIIISAICGCGATYLTSEVKELCYDFCDYYYPKDPNNKKCNGQSSGPPSCGSDKKGKEFEIPPPYFGKPIYFI